MFNVSSVLRMTCICLGTIKPVCLNLEESAASSLFDDAICCGDPTVPGIILVWARAAAKEAHDIYHQEMLDLCAEMEADQIHDQQDCKYCGKPNVICDCCPGCGVDHASGDCANEGLTFAEEAMQAVL